MATIKLQNGKVITKDEKVSCNCCACFGCGSVAEITEATTITIGGSIFGSVMPLTLPPQIVSIVEPFDSVFYSQEYPEYNLTGSAGGSLCGAVNSAAYIFQGGVLVENVGVGFGIIRENDECVVQLGASYSLTGPADYSAFGNGGTTIPLADLIGTHYFTFPVTGCFYPQEGGSECVTTNFSAVISIE